MVVEHLRVADLRVFHVAEDGGKVCAQANVRVQHDTDAEVHENGAVAGNQGVAATNAQKSAPIRGCHFTWFVILGTLEFCVGTYGERERHKERCQKFCLHYKSSD